jgi:hypothetical protein
MAMGMPAAQARVLGFDPPTTFNAAGTVQGTATLLTANHAVITTASSNTGVILADAQQMYYIQTTGGQTAKVYPPSGASFSGQTANTAISVPDGKALFIEPGGTTGITWSVSA